MNSSDVIVSGFFVLFFFSVLEVSNVKAQKNNTKVLDGMKIYVPAEKNRPVSFTNGEAAYFYTQTHQPNHKEYAWFEGLNIAQNRILGGYNLYADNKEIDNRKAKVWVYPYKLLRKHENGLKEEVWMIDGKNILDVSFTGVHQTIGIALKGKNVNYQNQRSNIAFFSSMEGPFVIAVSSKNGQPIHVENQVLSTAANAGGFYIAVGKTAVEAASLILATRQNIVMLRNERTKRMQTFLLQNAYTLSNIDSLNLALNWIETTMNQLVTKQSGYGIYAGLPWFNEYWGRDEFISLPGAILVTGQFETARKILQSFAHYQQTDTNSKFFGRVPNIVKPANIDYHTTDGTPRFIIQLQEYVKYSGDTSLIKELYPAVQLSIEGALKYWVDDKGYLVHEDNETWMDARDEQKRSYSPRGTRANDIQSLWYNQLCAGIYFATYMKDAVSLNKWRGIANKVKSNFEKDYRDTTHDYLADRLTKENQADFTLRPNQLFALDMIADTVFRSKVTKKVWQELVYPWGVATLDRHNLFFHPFHLTPDYPKDEAYHNGTIWPWLNGIAMQRMIEAEQIETAYKLFKNMNRQALTRGVVGGLGENLDAYPHKGQSYPTLTGAYLQAWSNAEQLRIWYQYFLGIRPDLTNNALIIAPRIPNEIRTLDYHILIGNGLIVAKYTASPVKTYRYTFNRIGMNATIDISPYEIKEISIKPNSTLWLSQTANILTISLFSKTGEKIKEVKAFKSPLRIERNGSSNELLRNIKFAEPIDLKNHPVISRN